MQKQIKTTLNYLIQFFLLVFPFWISRLWLIFSNQDLSIDNVINYLFYAIRFDLKTMAIWYAPLFILLGIHIFFKKKWLKQLSLVVFSILFLLAFSFNIIAVLYYPFSKSIAGIEIFQLLKGQDSQVIWSYIIDYWLIFLLSTIVVGFVIYAYNYYSFSIQKKFRNWYLGIHLILIVFLARGGIALKPLNLMDAYARLSNKEVTSAVSPLYVLLESYGKQQITYEAYFSDESLSSSMVLDVKNYSDFKIENPNICLILLESFGKEYTGANISNRPSYTPFIDSLSNHSIHYINAYANGLRSIDAVASCMAGIPSLMKQPFIGSLYTQSSINTLPKVLKNTGYHTSFFHGADELSMGFKPYLESQQIGGYFAKQNYPSMSDFDGTWGIFDGPFLSYFASKLDHEIQPWFSGIFTLSSHHPYHIPREYNHLPIGSLEIHQSIRYTDESLRLFFASISKKSWFKNTIFIITADHSSINETPPYQTYRGKYEVPLMIYAPSIFKPKKIEMPVQHIDIFSTIQHIASSGSHLALGHTLLDSSSRDIVHFDGNIYVYTTDSLSLEWNGKDYTRLYNYKKDPVHFKNLADIEPETTLILLNKLKMYIQKYNYRLLNDKF